MPTLATFPSALRFQRDLDRLFARPSFAVPERESIGVWSPAVDIYEDKEGVTLTAELPGLDPNTIDLRVENNVLTLKGERTLEKEETRENYRRVERSYGSFTRSFTLPPSLDTENIRAESKNGLLKVFLPRREETKAKQIQVKIEA